MMTFQNTAHVPFKVIKLFLKHPKKVSLSAAPEKYVGMGVLSVLRADKKYFLD
jgi:hypothetical protein